MLLATLRVGQPAPAPSPILLASSRPFLPTGIGSRVASRGEVPMPQDRPYTLGEDQGSAEPSPGANLAAARPRMRTTPSFDDRFASNRVPSVIAEPPRNPLQNPSPIAAYAPPQASPSILTGRGLY